MLVPQLFCLSRKNYEIRGSSGPWQKLRRYVTSTGYWFLNYFTTTFLYFRVVVFVSLFLFCSQSEVRTLVDRLVCVLWTFGVHSPFFNSTNEVGLVEKVCSSTILFFFVPHVRVFSKIDVETFDRRYDHSMSIVYKSLRWRHVRTLEQLVRSLIRCAYLHLYTLGFRYINLCSVPQKGKGTVLPYWFGTFTTISLIFPFICVLRTISCLRVYTSRVRPGGTTRRDPEPRQG